MIRLGVSGSGYIEERNLTSLPFAGVQLTRTYDVFNVVNLIQRKLFSSSHALSVANCLYYDFGVNRRDLLHLVNSISGSSDPWVVSFSHYLPRWNPRSRYGLKLLSGDACKKLIAISDFACRAQLRLAQEYPEYADAIRRKLCILHPAQAPAINTYEEKSLDPDLISFSFVGRDFFRKGGMEILRVFEQLVKEHAPVKLNIVSTLEYGDYASKATAADAAKARQLIASLGDHVNYVPEMSNSEVMKLFIASDVGLLPTYDDIYGYSVLECQAAGCPVISTDVEALPEINSDSIGWLIAVPKDSTDLVIRTTEQERSDLSALIQDRLYATVRSICDNRASIRAKGMRSLDRVKKECRPRDRAAALENIYREAMGLTRPEEHVISRYTHSPSFGRRESTGVAAKHSPRIL